MVDQMDTIEGNLTLRWFEKHGDRLIGSEHITSVSIRELCSILNLKYEDYPFVGGCHPLKEAEMPALKGLITHCPNFDQYEYFIGCYSKKCYPSLTSE